MGRQDGRDMGLSFGLWEGGLLATPPMHLGMPLQTVNSLLDGASSSENLWVASPTGLSHHPHSPSPLPPVRHQPGPPSWEGKLWPITLGHTPGSVSPGRGQQRLPSSRPPGIWGLTLDPWSGVRKPFSSFCSSTSAPHASSPPGTALLLHQRELVIGPGFFLREASHIISAELQAGKHSLSGRGSSLVVIAPSQRFSRHA